MNDIKVSVWCTCYNHEKYIRQCLNGFVNQKTNFNYEVIIHDDASIDNSPAIIKEYAEKYPNIIKPIFQKENQFSKNVDLEKEFFLPNIHGKYVAFCEGDDFWCNENKLQIQYDVMSNYNFSSCFHLTQLITEDGKLIENKTFPSIIENRILTIFQGKFPSDCILYFLLNGNCFIHVSSLIVSTEKYIEYITNLPEFAKSIRAVKIGDAPMIAFFASLNNTCYLPFVFSCYRTCHKGSFSDDIRKKIKNDQNGFMKIINAWKDMYQKYDEYTNHIYKKLIIDSNNLFRIYK